MVDFVLKKPQSVRDLPLHTEDFKRAKAFAEEVQKEFGNFVRSIILFCSSVRPGDLAKESMQGKDIDVLILIDDLSLELTAETSQSYRVIVQAIAARHSKLLHITTMKLTNFWDYLKSGDPIMINMLRDGIILTDSGIFAPMQKLLYQGRIRPTQEAVWIYFSKAPLTIKNSQWHILQAMVDLYWAVIDASHAILMQYGHMPPSPSQVAGLLRRTLCKQGVLPAKYADEMNEFYTTAKKILHREVSWISGKEYDQYLKRAQQFVKTIEDIIGRK